jgi:cytidyltransferase-like protein
MTRTVIIFGVFDGVHEGHLDFIHQAKKEGDQLVAIVARDEVVEKLKGKRPINDEAMRIKALLDVDDVDLVYLGDKNEGTYNIVKEVKPSIIYLGYDQTDLSEDLKKAIKEGTIPEIEIKQGVSYKGDTLHSSLLNKL